MLGTGRNCKRHANRGTRFLVDTPEPETVEQSNDVLDELETAVEQLGDAGGFVRIFKRPDEGGPLAIAERVPAAGFDPFTVAKRWGAGEFRFQFCNSGGRAIQNVTRRLLAPPPDASPPQASTELTELRSSLEASRKEHQEFMSKLLVSLLAQRESAAAPSSGPSLTDFAAIMKEAREAASATQTPAETVRELVSLGIDLSRGRGDDDGGDGMFEKLAPRVLDLLTSMTAKGANGEPAPAAVGVDPDLAAVVRQFAPKIIAEAQQGRDPFLWGSFIAERTPEAFLPHLNYLCGLSPEDRREVFARLDSRVLPYMAWLDTAAEGIQETLAGGPPSGEDDAAVIPDGPRGTGEGPNPAPDA